MKVVEQTKKQMDKFTRLTNVFTKKEPKNRKYAPISLKDVESDISTYSKRYNNMTSLSVKLDDLKQSGVADIGLSDSAMESNVVWNNTDATSSNRKMRRIVSSNKESGNAMTLLTGQNRLFSKMFYQQSTMMTKMHSESLALSSRFQNSQLNYMKQMTESVQQIYKLKNTVELEYFKNSLQTQGNILEELKSIHKTLRTGLNVNERGEKEIPKAQESLIRSLFSGGNLKGKTKQLVSSLMKDIANDATGGVGTAAVTTLSMLPMMSQMMGGGGGLLTYGIKSGLDFGLSQMLGQNRNGRRAMQAIKSPGDFFESLMNSWAISNGGMKGYLGKKLGSKNRINDEVDLNRLINKDNKDRAMFDNAAHTALTRVITKSLANIESALTGNVAMYYNYATNRFETMKEAEASLRKGNSYELNRVIKDARKDIMGGKVTEHKNILGEKVKTVESGLFSDVLKITNKLNDQNLEFVKRMIELRGEELADGLLKIMSYIGKTNSNPGEILNNSDLNVNFILNALFSREVLNKAKGKDLDNFINTAENFRIFITKLRDLPQKDAREVWDKIMYLADRTRTQLIRAMEKSFDETSGSVAQWDIYNRDTIVQKDGKAQVYTRDENRYNIMESRRKHGILSDVQIDLTGITSPEAAVYRIKEEYNKMMSPLFKGTIDKTRQNLKAKAAQLKRENHIFAPYVEKLANVIDKAGDTVFSEVNYAELAGINSADDLEKVKPPKLQGWTIKDQISSAVDIAKWHLERNAKVRGVAATAGAASYGTLIKMMYEKTGMVGPVGSTILGITAASAAIMSGKMTKIMDIMATDIGDEKMRDKDGNETNVTKRQALNEAMYREFLPKMWGQATGAKLGGWIKNNIRFGPILGPVVGMTTGWILGQSSHWVVKLAGVFGKMGKNLLNALGGKITGERTANWGDMIRDVVRERLGLAPIGSQMFSSKDVFDQTGDPNATKTDNIISTLTGQRILPKNDIQNRYYNIRARYMASKNNINDFVNDVGPSNYKGLGLDTNYSDFYDNEDRSPLFNLPQQPVTPNVMTVKVAGGHLDAIGVVGTLDSETYASKLKNMKREASKEETASRATSKAKPVGARSVSTPRPDKTTYKSLTSAEMFTRQDPIAKRQTQQQNIQEKTEQENRENIRILAEGGTIGKKKPKKEKGKGFFDGLIDLFSGAAGISGIIKFLSPLLGGAIAIPLLVKFVPKIIQYLPKLFNVFEWGNVIGDAVGGVGKAAGLAGKGFDFMSKSYAGLDREGDIFKDSKISAGIDLFKLFRAGIPQNVAKNIGKYGVNRWNKSLIGKGVNYLAKPGVEMGQRGLKLAGKNLEFLTNYFGLKNSSRLSSLLAEEAGETVVKIAGKGLQEGGEQIVESAGKSIIKGAAKSGEIGKIMGWAMKALDALDDLVWKIPGMKKFAKKIGGTLVPGLKKIAQELVEKVSSKLIKEGAEKAGKRAILGTIKGALTSGVVTAWINVGFIAWDAWQGAKKAKEFFQIAEQDQPTAIQKWACAIAYGILGLFECVPGAMIVTMIVSAMDSAMKWFCHRIYELLDGCLSSIGLGESSEEKEEYQILKEGTHISEDGSLFSTKQDARTNRERIITEVSQGANTNNGNNPFGNSTQQMLTVGGSGTDVPNTRISGRPATSRDVTNAPTFYSQYSLPGGRVGSLDIQDDGCALAVMKMIASYQGYNISDSALINKMSQYTLSGRSVSVSFFRDFGGQVTENKEDIRSALRLDNVAMAVLTRSGNGNHFVAIISKDKNTVYVGDPLKAGWEILPKNDYSIASRAIAAAIFGTAIITNIGTPAKRKSRRGGSGVGGFGTQAKSLNFKASSYRSHKPSSEVPTSASQIVINNQTPESEATTPQHTTESGTVSSGPIGKGWDAIFRSIATGEHGTADWKSEKAIGAAYQDSGPGRPYAYGLQGLSAKPDGSFMKFINKHYKTLGLTRPPTVEEAKGGSFVQVWKNLAKEKKDLMLNTQIQYFRDDYLPMGLGGDTLENALAKRFPKFKNNLGMAMYLADSSVQYGGIGAGLPRWLVNNYSKYNTPEELINAGHAAEKQNERSWFRNHFKQGGKSLIGRFNKRRDWALRHVKEAFGMENSSMANAGKKALETASNAVAKVGGNGVGKLYWGRGNVGYTKEAFAKSHTMQKFVSDRLGLTDHSTTCGLAVGLTLQKLVFHNSRDKFTPHMIKDWGERTGSFNKDLGVSQHFFINMGMTPLDIRKIARTVQANWNNNAEPQIPLSTFTSHGNSGPTKWGVAIGDILVLQTAERHWIMMIATRAGGTDRPIYYLSNPMKSGIELAQARFAGWTNIIYALKLSDISKLVNISNNKQGTSVGAMGGGTDPNKVKSGKDSTIGGTDASYSQTTASDAGQTSMDDSAVGTASSKPKQRNRGTGAAFGGWFYRGADGEIKQLFFDGTSGDVATDTTGADVSSGTTPNVGVTKANDIVKNLPVENGSSTVNTSSPAYKAAEYALKRADGKPKSRCGEFVGDALEAGFKVSLKRPRHACSWWGGRVSGNSIDNQCGNVENMKKMGYHMISVESTPQVGDVMAYTKPNDPGHYGHVCIYTTAGWVSDFRQKSYFVYSKSGSASNSKYTLWRFKESGGDDAANYYSKGSKSYNTEQLYDKTIESIRNSGNTNNTTTNGMRTIKSSSDPSRNLSLYSRDINAKAEYYRKMRTSTDGYKTKKAGPLSVSWKNDDMTKAKLASTASGALQDYGSNSNNQLVQALTGLIGAITDQTVQTKLANKTMIEETKKQTASIKDATSATKESVKSTSELAKKPIVINTPMTSDDKEAISKEFSLISTAEKEMFAGLSN